MPDSPIAGQWCSQHLKPCHLDPQSPSLTIPPTPPPPPSHSLPPAQTKDIITAVVAAVVVDTNVLV